MNHKLRRLKNRRAGCLLCKPDKANGCGHARPASERRHGTKDEAIAERLREPRP